MSDLESDKESLASLADPKWFDDTMRSKFTGYCVEIPGTQLAVVVVLDSN